MKTNLVNEKQIIVRVDGCHLPKDLALDTNMPGVSTVEINTLCMNINRKQNKLSVARKREFRFETFQIKFRFEYISLFFVDETNYDHQYDVTLLSSVSHRITLLSDPKETFHRLSSLAIENS